MKKKRGRKPNRAVLSGIKPDQDTWDEIRCRLTWGSAEWPMVALRHWIATDQRQKIAPFMSFLIADCERAALEGDTDWFRRQADAIEKGGTAKDENAKRRAKFYAWLAYLFEQAMREMCKTVGLQKNWRPLTNAEREAYPKRSHWIDKCGAACG
jgi:hypothetical protein